MKSNGKIFRGLLMIYIVVAIVTWGHAWNRGKRFDPAMVKWGDPTCLVICTGMCSVFWPLYWSSVYWAGAHGVTRPT